MATKVLIFSQVLSCFFVGSVTFWYMLTPYLVKPHPDIMDDMYVVLCKCRGMGTLL